VPVQHSPKGGANHFRWHRFETQPAEPRPIPSRLPKCCQCERSKSIRDRVFLRRIDQCRTDATPGHPQIDRDVGHIEHAVHWVQKDEANRPALDLRDDDLTSFKPAGFDGRRFGRERKSVACQVPRRAAFSISWSRGISEASPASRTITCTGQGLSRSPSARCAAGS
jgi:hypothetical protein